jgi:hypothetical protein
MDGPGPGKALLVRAGLPLRGGRVQSGQWHRDFDPVLVLVKLPKVFFETRTRAAAPRRGTQDQAARCLGRSDPQTKAPHLTNDLISMGPNPSTQTEHATLVVLATTLLECRMITTAWWSATHARTRASL